MMPFSPRTLSLALVCAMSVMGSACGGGLTQAPAFPSNDDGFETVDASPSGVDEDPARPLSLYPGDVVTLRLTSTEVTQIAGLTVDERGMLHVPLVGDVDVAGRPLAEAEQRIETGMRPFDSTVRISILLTQPLGHMASVIGAVGEQGRIPVQPGMRLADLLAAAGGPLGGALGSDEVTADLHAARLLRRGTALPVSLALAVTGDPRHNVRVQPGDHVYVPALRGTLISVIGEVSAARVIPHQPGLRLSQALALAGGFTRDANGGDIRIIRGPSESPRVFRAAIDHVAAGEHPDPVLAPGDIVFVGSSAMADFRDAMAAVASIFSLGATTAIGVAVANP